MVKDIADKFIVRESVPQSPWSQPSRFQPLHSDSEDELWTGKMRKRVTTPTNSEDLKSKANVPFSEILPGSQKHTPPATSVSASTPMAEIMPKAKKFETANCVEAVSKRAIPVHSFYGKFVTKSVE